MNAVEVEALRFGYDDQLTVDIGEFALEQGQSVAVIGPSGCGKTSFLHLLAGLLRPQSGTVRLLGQDLAELRGASMDRFRGQNIGLVLQRFHLIKALTVRENVLLASKLSRAKADGETVDALLKRLNIDAVAQHKPSMLSQGQAQRAAIARALVHKPPIVMADEPTSALDDEHAAEAIGLLRDAVSEAGATLIVVTHDQRIRGTLDRDFDFGVSS
ncbi:MAG: ATP-binding cassette domain-containing protein [Planctomycetota bacterium]